MLHWLWKVKGKIWNARGPSCGDRSNSENFKIEALRGNQASGGRERIHFLIYIMAPGKMSAAYSSVGWFFSFGLPWKQLESLFPDQWLMPALCSESTECKPLDCQGIPYMCVSLGDYIVSTLKYPSLVKSWWGKIVVDTYSVHQGWIFVFFHFRCYK